MSVGVSVMVVVVVSVMVVVVLFGYQCWLWWCRLCLCCWGAAASERGGVGEGWRS